MREYYVYILANKKNGTLYTGVTNNLVRRTYKHKQSNIESFTKKFNVNRLVYYEDTNDIDSAIHREKDIKAWCRYWKIKLIEKENPDWQDLYYDIIG